MRRYAVMLLALILASIIFAGCGETLNGISRDFKRIGKGIKTVFVRDE